VVTFCFSRWYYLAGRGGISLAVRLGGLRLNRVGRRMQVSLEEPGQAAVSRLSMLRRVGTGSTGGWRRARGPRNGTISTERTGRLLVAYKQNGDQEFDLRLRQRKTYFGGI